MILLVGGPDYSGMPLVQEQGWAFSPSHFIQQHPAVRVLEFAAGVMVGRHYLTGQREKWSPSRATIMQVLSLVWVLAFAVTAYPMKVWLGQVAGIRQIGFWYNQSGGFAAFAFLIYAFAHGDGLLSRHLASTLLTRLGEMSFSLYMVHQLFIRWSEDKFWIDRFGYGPALTFVIALSFGTAYLVWKFVEVPARRLLIAGVATKFPRAKAV